jgi:uncharacterized protein (TIGR02466 family)
MNNSQINLVELFPVPVGITSIDRDLTAKELDILTNQAQSSNTGNSHSTNSRILDTPGLEDIKTFIENSLKKYFEQTYTSANDIKLYITQSWTNYTLPGQYHHKHSHSNSLVSGVFYISTVDDRDRIMFFRPGSEVISLPAVTYHRYNSSAWWLEAITGNLMLFPSSLEHMVETTQTDKTRISLSFNTFVSGQLGTPDSMNYLELP